MAEEQGQTEELYQLWNTGFMAYLDGLLAALDLLYLSLSQGNPLPNGLQLASTQLHLLGDPAKEKHPEAGSHSKLSSLCAPVPTMDLRLLNPQLGHSAHYNLPVGAGLNDGDLTSTSTI